MESYNYKEMVITDIKTLLNPLMYLYIYYYANIFYVNSIYLTLKANL